MPEAEYVFFDAELGVTSVLLPPIWGGDRVMFLNFPAKTDSAVYSNNMDKLVERIGSAYA